MTGMTIDRVVSMLMKIRQGTIESGDEETRIFLSDLICRIEARRPALEVDRVSMKDRVARIVSKWLLRHLSQKGCNDTTK